MTPEADRSVHLDAARAIAALTVFSWHARGVFLNSFHQLVARLQTSNGGAAVVSAASTVPAPHEPGLSFAHQAVIVFFVLSGYLVGGSVLRNVGEHKWSWRIYMAKRLGRLWLVLIPALILTLILDAIGHHIAPSNSIYATTNLSMAPGPTDLRTVFGNVFFVQDILTSVLGTNAPLWSLSYEFWYYVSFPILALAATASGWIGRAAWLAALCVVGLFVGPDIAVYFVIWLMGLLPQVLPRCRVSSFVVGICAVAVPVVAGVLLKLQLGVTTSDMILGLVFTAWCYLAKQAPPVNHKSLYALVSIQFSEFSYTLYLVHYPILCFLSALIVGRWATWPYDPPHVAMFAAVWFGVLATAYGLYLLFERNTGRIQRLLIQMTAPAKAAA